MLTKDNLNEALADAVMDRPREFFIDDRRFCLWSPSLGVSMMIERHIKELCIDYELLKKQPYMEAMNLVSNKRFEVCYILSVMSYRRFTQLSNSTVIKKRATFFYDNLKDDELAQLILIVLTCPRPESLMVLSGIDKEQQRQSEIMNHKNSSSNNQSFGGKTIFGSLIDIACKTYGWTKKYVVWGIDLISLRMMLADTVNSVYLSDDEAKALGLTAHPKEVYGMTPEDIAKLKAMDCWE